MHKTKFVLTKLSPAILFTLFLTGCSPEQDNQPHVLSFDVSSIENVTISYDEEEITFYECEGEELIIKEYMSDCQSRYYAKAASDDTSIRVTEGGKPFFHSNFSRTIEVYLPSSYHKALTVTTTNGDIDLTAAPLTLTSLRVDTSSGCLNMNLASASEIYLSTTSGTLNLGQIDGDQIHLETSSGDVNCADLSGNVSYISTSGSAVIQSATGSGSYQSKNSGVLDITYTEITGDLYLFNKNSDIKLKIPQNYSYELKASSKNGSVSTPYQDSQHKNKGELTQTIGHSPQTSIELETKNGNILLEQ